MKDNTPTNVKEERLQRLNELINKDAKNHNLEYVGNTYKVLILGVSEKEDRLYGYTETMKLVNVKTSPDNIGKIIDVKITDAKSFSLDGESL